MKKMSILNKKYLSKMCRLCLLKSDDLTVVFSFSSELNGSIAVAISKCTSVNIKKYDKLPIWICETCYDQLVKTHKFQMQAAQSDRTLRNCRQQLLAVDTQNSDIVDKTSGLCDENTLLFRDKSSQEVTNFLRDTIIKSGETDYDLEIAKQYEKTACDVTDMTINEETKCTDTPFESKKTMPYFAEVTIKSEETAYEFTETAIENNVSFTDSEVCFTDKNKPQAVWITDESCGSLMNAELTVKSELQSNDPFENEANIKQENAKFNVTLLSTVVNVKNNDNDERDHTPSVNKRPRLYQCDVCNKFFKQQSNLISHKRTHTGEKPYQCDVCKKCFARSSQMNTHKRIHTGEKPYQCNVCNKCFTEPGSLRRHKRIHTGEKPYQCDVCNKCFIDSTLLNRHMFLHTGMTQYQCDVCNKFFTNSSNLKIHKLSHTKEKPYQCDICNKSFSQPTTLKNHKLTHTTEKPYKCDICKKCFTQSSTLKYHKRTHTGEKPYKCDICNTSFCRSEILTKHMRRHV